MTFFLTPTELHRATVASRCHWNEVRVCIAIHLTDGIKSKSIVQSPGTLATTKKIEEHILPQVQLTVVLGLQYAAAAKNVKGSNAKICAELRVVMPGSCLLEGLTMFNPLTMEAKREAKMKPVASIIVRSLEEGVLKTEGENVLCTSTLRCRPFYQKAREDRNKKHPKMRGHLHVQIHRIL